MQMRFIWLLFAAFSSSVRTFFVGKAGHETRESRPVLLRLFLAWGQKAQFAVHLLVL